MTDQAERQRMFKLVYMLCRRPELTREQFQQYWLNTHGPLVRSYAEVLGIRRYVQTHTASTDMNEQLVASRGIEAAPYDGIAELWYDSEESLRSRQDDPRARAAVARLVEDEARFIDFARSPLWWSVEHEMIG